MKFYEIINQWEKQNNIFEIASVDDFDFYSYMRREFVNSTYDLTIGRHIDHLSIESKESSLKLFFRLAKKSSRLSLKKPELIILNHTRKILDNDKYICPFTDFIAESFPNSLYFERLHTNHSHLEPAASKYIYYVDRATLYAYTYRLFCKYFSQKKYNELYLKIKNIMDSPFDRLEEILNVTIDRNSYYTRCRELYYFVKVKRKIYSKLLDRTKPKVLIETVGGSIDAKLFNELCKDKKIPTIELQHCLLGVTAHYPAGVKEKQFADYYFTYSEYWKNYCDFPIADDHIIACGNDNFEKQLAKHPKITNRDKKCIIFLSGPGYGHELSLVARDLQNLIPKDKFEILYKLHPAEMPTWKQDYPELYESGVNVIDKKEIGIYECLAKSDIQIGVFSTTIYEGLAFNLNTFILNNPAAEEFIDFCNEGFGILVNDAQDFYDKLIHNVVPSKNYDYSYFWKNNAKENVINAIKEVIKDE